MSRLARLRRKERTTISSLRAPFGQLYVWLPVVLVGPPTLAMGASFPFLQKVALLDLDHIGRRVGGILLANVAGSTAGAVLTGWLGLTWLGSAGLLPQTSWAKLSQGIKVKLSGPTWGEPP